MLFDALNRLYYDLTLDELRHMNNNNVYPNITHNSLLYLDMISYREKCTVSYLAELLHVSKSAVTIKVNELMKQGLIEKTQSNEDRRVFYLRLAPAVQQDYKRYDRKLKRAAEHLEERYSSEELKKFKDMLKQVSEAYLE